MEYKRNYDQAVERLQRFWARELDLDGLWTSPCATTSVWGTFRMPF